MYYSTISLKVQYFVVVAIHNYINRGCYGSTCYGNRFDINNMSDWYFGVENWEINTYILNLFNYE